MCCRLRGSKARPLRGHMGGVQSSKPLENSHWLLDYPSIGFSMASLCALNSPNVFKSLEIKFIGKVYP